MSFRAFMDQMEENVRFNLTYPFHINHTKKMGRKFYNENLEVFHEHYFEDVLSNAYMEPLAFYLTEEDKKAYSAQEIEFIEKVIAREAKRIEDGYEMVTLELDEDTINKLNEYKLMKNMTFEEAVNDILTEMIQRYKDKTPEEIKKDLYEEN